MKKTLLVLLAGVLLAISSCSKDGVNGTNGTNASAAYQLTFTIDTNSWVKDGTAGTPGTQVQAQLVSPYLSLDSVGNGSVNVYWLRNGTDFAALPYINYNSSGTEFNFEYDWYPNPGAISIGVYNSLNGLTTFSSAVTFVVVVVPGTKSLPSEVDRNNYASIEAYYHPRKVN